MRFLIYFTFFYSLFELRGQSFDVFADNNKIPVIEQNDLPKSLGLSAYKFARIPYQGKPIKIKIEVSNFYFENNDWSISPKRYKINGLKSGNNLSFDINRLGYLVIIFKQNQDFTKRLILFIEKPDKLPENRVNIVKTYGVDNSGYNNETKKIQAALNDISGSGKVLYFPPGTYKTFRLNFKSNSHIHLDKNARIMADSSLLSSYFSNDESGLNSFILIKDSENIKISGLGILDGNGTQICTLLNKELSKSLNIRLLLIYRSQNIDFNGVLLKDSARWNTHILESNRVNFSYCKLINNPNQNEFLGSQDGWDPDSSKNILIEKCFGWAGDDTVAIKCTGKGNSNGRISNSENITVRGNVFLTKKSGLKIGTETFCSQIQNIVFENNDVIESDRVMGINVRDGALVQNVIFRKNRAEFHFPDRKQNGMNFYISKRNNNTSGLGKIQKVSIEHCTFEHAFPKKFAFYRHYHETAKTDLSVTIKDLVIDGKLVDNLSPEFFDLTKNNAQLIFDNSDP